MPSFIMDVEGGFLMDVFKNKICRFSGVAFWVFLCYCAYFVVMAIVRTVLWSFHINAIIPGITNGYMLELPGLNVTLVNTNWLGIVIAIMVSAAAADVFRVLRKIGTPFNSEVTQRFKRLGIYCLPLFLRNDGFSTLLLIAFIWILYLIFEYGKGLQQDNDTFL